MERKIFKVFQNTNSFFLSYLKTLGVIMSVLLVGSFFIGLCIYVILSIRPNPSFFDFFRYNIFLSSILFVVAVVFLGSVYRAMIECFGFVSFSENEVTFFSLSLSDINRDIHILT